METGLPKYKCHKIVRAARIDSIETRESGDVRMVLDGGAARLFDANWASKRNPQVGSYFVEYDDDYASVSPAKAFEDGYTLVSAL